MTLRFVLVLYSFTFIRTTLNTHMNMLANMNYYTKLCHCLGILFSTLIDLSIYVLCTLFSLPLLLAHNQMALNESYSHIAHWRQIIIMVIIINPTYCLATFFFLSRKSFISDALSYYWALTGSLFFSLPLLFLWHSSISILDRAINLWNANECSGLQL